MKMILIYIWIVVGGCIGIALLFDSMVNFGEDRSKWWLLQVLGIAIGWPIIAALILAFGIYSTIKMNIW